MWYTNRARKEAPVSREKSEKSFKKAIDKGGGVCYNNKVARKAGLSEGNFAKIIDN